MSKVRIINDETGDVKYVSAYVAGQADQLAQYGYRVEDLKAKGIIILEEVGELESEQKDLFKEEEYLSKFDTPRESEIQYAEQNIKSNAIERKKPGPKPKVKEVTETE